MFKQERDSYQTKFKELTTKYEASERELETKRAILEKFEQNKKSEMKDIKQTLDVLKTNTLRKAMIIEDLSCDLRRHQTWLHNLR